MTRLFDTTAASAWMWADPMLLAYLDSLPPTDWIITCPTVRGEILFGVWRMPDGRKKRDLAAKARQLFRIAPCVSAPPSVGDGYARVKLDCEQSGRGVAENDLWIAATAIALDATLLTRDRDFAQVEGLRTADWTP